jgi:hypothetical protein
MVAWYRLKLVAHLLIKEGEKNSWLLTEFLCKMLIAYANGDAKRQNCLLVKLNVTVHMASNTIGPQSDLHKFDATHKE